MNFKIIFTKYDLLFLEYILTRFMNGVFINKNMILNSFNSKKNGVKCSYLSFLEYRTI